MIVVSDTSPLSYLHQVGRLHVLSELYGEVIIPPAVEKELRTAEEIHAGLDWSLLRVISPKDRGKVDALLADLDLGETEAIVLAQELEADLLLIDEASGREVARRFGLRRTGLLGVLLEAKRNGIVPSLNGELERLLKETTFRLHPAVRSEVLRLAGESE